MGRRATASACDVSDPDAIVAFFRHLDHEYGRVDFLGNIAGDGHLARPEDLTIADLHRVLQNLVVGRFSMCQEAGRRMLAQGRGSIMNIGSLASTTALGRGHIAYSMAMGAVIQMTRELSTEWSCRGVRVNCVTPAVADTDILKQMTEAHVAFMLGKIPMGRFVQIDEIAAMVAWLASSDCSFTTAGVFDITGGRATY